MNPINDSIDLFGEDWREWPYGVDRAYAIGWYWALCKHTIEQMRNFDGLILRHDERGSISTNELIEREKAFSMGWHDANRTDSIEE